MMKKTYSVLALSLICLQAYCQTVSALVKTLSVEESQKKLESILQEYPDFVTFFNLYNQEISSSHDKLTLMHKKKNLFKLGHEIINGNISGSLTYRTTLKGVNGIVIMEYKNYQDEPGWILNGFTNTKADICANGRMFGTIEISGKYSAKIIYDNLVIVKGKAAGGYYTVIYPDGSRADIAWNSVSHNE